jgi:hypothetical protein
MLYSFRPGIPSQVLPETPNVGPIDVQQLLDVPGKKDLRFLYDMPYRNINDKLFMNVPGKKDLRFLYDMLYNDNRPRVTPRQSKYLNTSWTRGGK